MSYVHHHYTEPYSIILSPFLIALVLLRTFIPVIFYRCRVRVAVNFKLSAADRTLPRAKRSCEFPPRSGAVRRQSTSLVPEKAEIRSASTAAPRCAPTRRNDRSTGPAQPTGDAASEIRDPERPCDRLTG